MIAIGCLIIIAVQVLVAILIWSLKANFKIKDGDRILRSISILVPYHNEEDRIIELINSLNKLKWPNERQLIFVNDHSTDKTSELIEAKLQHPYLIVDNSYNKGKKWAIKKGVESANYDWVLTWDADVQINADYWSALNELPEADMIVLPVKLKGNRAASIWAKIEHAFLRFFQDGAASIKHPALASGANLLFRKATFLELESQRTDYAIPSGDDVFLLDQMYKSKKEILNVSKDVFSVYTAAPFTWKTLFQQRKRWSSKVGHMRSRALLPAGLLLILIQCAVYGVLWLAFINPYFFILIGIKIVLEMAIVGTYYKLKIDLLGWIIINQLLYPFILIIGLLPREKETRWEVVD